MYIVPEATRTFSAAPVTTHVTLARSHDGSGLLIWTGTMNRNSDAEARWLQRRSSAATHPARAIMDKLRFTLRPPTADRRPHWPVTTRPGVLMSRSLRVGGLLSTGLGCRGGGISADTSAGAPDELPLTTTRPGVLISRSVRAGALPSTRLDSREGGTSADTSAGTPGELPPTTTRPGVLITRSVRASALPSTRLDSREGWFSAGTAD